MECTSREGAKQPHAEYVAPRFGVRSQRHRFGTAHFPREALEKIERALAIRPGQSALTFYKVTILLQGGDLAAARETSATIRQQNEVSAFGAYLSLHPENTWVFTDSSAT